MRIQVFANADADPEPHFVAFIIKGDHYYIYGGEEYTQIHRLHKRKFTNTLFNVEKRELLLQIIGETWDHAKYCLKGDFSGYSVIFLPKVILKNPSNMWD